MRRSYVTLLLSLLGAGLILVAVRDIFDTLFHPSGKGMLSRALPRFLWRSVRRIGGRYPLAQELCGPVTLLAVIASWAALLAVGRAFLFWPHPARGFLLAPGLSSLAHEVNLVREAESETEIGVRQMDALAAEQMLGSLTTQLIAVQTDLIHFPISYYFRSSNERFELSAAMPYLLRAAQEGDSADCAPGVRMRASMLRGAIADFSDTVGARFLDLPSASSDKVLRAYAHDNLHNASELKNLT